MFEQISDYVINIRREIHMYPETDFDLPKTVALVKRELEDMGIDYTEKYGKGSLAAYINPDKDAFTIAIRADMDALNMQERTEVDYASKIDGKMHACGHDAHTAMLLGTAKALKQIENELNCRVKFIFQPSEEGIKSGAAMMIENGVLDDVDVIIAAHVGNFLKSGKIGICPGASYACSRHFVAEFEGKSAHAAQAHTGIDALACAIRFYNDIQLIITREVPPLKNCLCSIGVLQSGSTHNVVAEHAVMKGTIRTFDNDLSKFIFDRIQSKAKSIEEDSGVKITLTGPLKSSCVYNNPYLNKKVGESFGTALGAQNIETIEPEMISEDFALYGNIVPAVIIRLGTGDKQKGIDQDLHHDNFNLSEDALICGVKGFVQCVVDWQNGIDKQKLEAADKRKKSN